MNDLKTPEGREARCSADMVQLQLEVGLTESERRIYALAWRDGAKAALEHAISAWLGRVSQSESSQTRFMKTFYATQGQSHTHRIQGVTVDCDSLVAIQAEDYGTAYAYANEIFNNKWCSLYEDDPHLEYYPRGVVLTLTAHKPTAEPEIKDLIP